MEYLIDYLTNAGQMFIIICLFSS